MFKIKRKLNIIQRSILISCQVIIITLFVFCGIFQFTQEDDDNSTHIKYFEHRYFISKTNKLILVWTPMFLKWGWEHGVAGLCSNRCSVTTDKSRIQEADAVLFHMYDLWFWIGFPDYRHPSQVWVVWCAEPTTRIWKDLSSYKHVFNYTMMYRQDSSVFAPFGKLQPLSDAEKITNDRLLKTRNFYKERPYFLAVTNSDCYDQSLRYRIIQELGKYIPVDFYGKCGNLSCPRFHPECVKKLAKYKFIVQFENSYCKDYITEKYWRHLRDDGVSIVNWKKQQQNYPVAKHSYINIFDFPDIKSAALYIKKVGENETLYNSYLNWKRYHKVIDTEILSGMRHLCDALHDHNKPAQIVKDLQKWLEDDSCTKGTPWDFLERRINRHLYDLGF